MNPLLLLLACRPGALPVVDSGAPADDTGEPSGPFADLVVAPTDVPTVLRASWTGSGADETWVVFTDADGRTTITPRRKGTSHLLLGLAPSQDVEVVACEDRSGLVACSAPATGRTGPLPASLPVLAAQGDPPAGFVATVLLQEEGAAVVIIDGQGRFVFHRALDTTAFRARLARDGSGILVNTQADRTEGAVVHLSWTGEAETLWTDPHLHTDFTELPDGRLAALFAEPVTCRDTDGGSFELISDAIWVWQDGEATRLWGAHDTIAMDCLEPLPGDSGDIVEWTHGNGLSYDPASGRFYVSLPLLQAVAAVDAATGEMPWAVSDLPLPPALPLDKPAAIVNPHSVYRTGDGEIVVFNRGDLDGGCSSVTWFQVDEARRSVHVSDSYTAIGDDGGCRATPLLGEAQPTADGGTMVIWTMEGVIERLDPERASVWTVSAPLGNAFGFGHAVPDLYSR